MNIDEEEIFHLLNAEPTFDPVSVSEPNQKTNFFKGNKFVFTGAFEGRTRKQLEQATIQYGGFVLNVVSRNTDFLVVADYGSMYSTKARDATRKGIPVMTETEWKIKEQEYLNNK